jgi:hypothetical protein
MKKRPGYYVEGRWFGPNYHQAEARARFLSGQYSRAVSVDERRPTGELLQVRLCLFRPSQVAA